MAYGPQIALRTPLVLRVSRAGLRGESGRYAKRAYISLQEARRVNEALAKEIQQKAVDFIADGSARPQTGRLKRVTGSPKNILVTDQGFGVGNVEFLQQSEARYWRTIEEGSAETFSRGGFAGALIYPRPWPGARIRMSGRLSWYSGVDPTGRFARGAPDAPFPSGKIAAVPYAIGPSLVARFPGYKPLVVKHEIQAQRYYERAFEAVQPVAQLNRSMRQIIDRAWKGRGV